MDFDADAKSNHERTTPNDVMEIPGRERLEAGDHEVESVILRHVAPIEQLSLALYFGPELEPSACFETRQP